MADIKKGIQDFEGLKFDTTWWPVVVMEFPEKRVPDGALQKYLSELETCARQALLRGERIFVVTDLTKMREAPNAAQRKETAAWMKRTDGLMKATSVGAAHVTPSALLRGLMTAVNWIQQPPNPSVCVATREEAYRAGIKLYQDARVAVPPSLAGLAASTKR